MEFVPKFKKGDILINLDGVGSFTIGKEYVLEYDSYMSDGQEFVRVRNDNGYVNSRYVFRFKLKEKEKPVEIVAGSVVKCVDAYEALHVLVPNAIYKVEKVYHAGLVKLEHLNKRFAIRRFAITNEEVKPVKVEPPSLLQILDEKADGRPGTATYAIRDDKGNINDHVRDACHARLNTINCWDGHIKRNSVVTEVALYLKGHVTGNNLNNYTQFVDYVINRSPAASCFIPTDAKEAVKLGVMMNVEANYNNLVTAAVFLRTGSEYSSKLPLFVDLVNMGFNENVAYVTSQLITISDGGYKYSGFGGGHHIFNSQMDREEFSKFWKEGFHKFKGEPYSHNHGLGYSIFKSIAKESPNSFGKFLSERLVKLKSCKIEENWGSKYFTLPATHISLAAFANVVAEMLA